MKEKRERECEWGRVEEAEEKERESLKKREWERCVLWEISLVPIFFYINVFLYVSKNYGVRYRTVQCHYIDFIVIVVNVMVKIRVISIVHITLSVFCRSAIISFKNSVNIVLCYFSICKQHMSLSPLVCSNLIDQYHNLVYFHEYSFERLMTIEDDLAS